jgi:hypothetical protein
VSYLQERHLRGTRNAGELSETTMREIRLLLHIREEHEFQFMLPTLISVYAHSGLGHWHQTFACLMTLISSELLSPFFVVLQILSKQMWNALKQFYGAFLQLDRNSNQRMVAIQKRSNLLTASVDWLLIVQQN